MCSDKKTEHKKKKPRNENSLKNLVDISTRSDFKELSSKGGKRKSAKLKEQANLRKAMRAILETELPDCDLKSKLKELGLSSTMQAGIALSVVLKTIKTGNHNGLDTVLRVLGETQSDTEKAEQLLRIETMKLQNEEYKRILSKQTQEVSDEESSVNNFLEAVGKIDMQKVFEDEIEE